MVKPKHDHNSDELFVSNQVSQDSLAERNSKKQKKIASNNQTNLNSHDLT